jgi:hypothetical protein
LAQKLHAALDHCVTVSPEHAQYVTSRNRFFCDNKLENNVSSKAKSNFTMKNLIAYL